jgi:hypothetical protein
VEFENLRSVDEELAGAQGVVIKLRAGRIGSNVGVKKEEFPVLYETVRIFEIRLTGADGFDFGSAQRNSGFISFEKKKIMRGGAIDAGVTFATGDRVALDVFRLVWLRQLYLVPGHGWDSC